MSGNRSSVREKTQSHTEPCAFWAFKDIETASGASSDVVGIDDDEPMCIDTTVAVSLQASHSGSHFPLCREGKPSLAGFSVNAMAKLPFAAQRRTSSAARDASHS